MSPDAKWNMSGVPMISRLSSIVIAGKAGGILDSYRLRILPQKLPQNYRQTTAKLPPNSPIKKVFEMISRMPNIPVRDIAKELGMTEDGIRYHIKKLSSAGIIRRVGNSRSGHWEIL